MAVHACGCMESERQDILLQSMCQHQRKAGNAVQMKHLWFMEGVRRLRGMLQTSPQSDHVCVCRLHREASMLHVWKTKDGNRIYERRMDTDIKAGQQPWEMQSVRIAKQSCETMYRRVRTKLDIGFLYEKNVDDGRR